jgi:hypothetical protein
LASSCIPLTSVQYGCVFNTELYPTPMETPKRSRTATRARLLEGALEVFAERGFAGASVEDICDQAGFTRGAFYSNFGSKDELVLALFQATTDRLLEQIEALTWPISPGRCWTPYWACWTRRSAISGSGI